ncbi:type VII secretion protein EccE [Nocardia salmonicida]|uniref:type VII secretion protein EccE n=1 Tax=Nocardia salmonicida TaxID=53431 RepID=UPI0036BF6268
MSSERRELFNRMPLSIVLPSAAAGAAATTLATALDVAVWVALGTGLVIALLGGARMHKTNIWRILGMRASLWWRNRRNAASDAPIEPFDVEIPESGGARCGMRWDGNHLITMLRLDRTAVRPTLLGSAHIQPGAAISLADVARCLSQFDIRLAAVDVVTLGVRTQGPHNVVRLYEKLLGPLPAAASHRVWLVLRFDPLDNVDAIDNRGSEQEGVVRTALVATRRVAGRLATRGVSVSVLTAGELAAAEAAALHDTDPRQWTEDWRVLRSSSVEMAGYAVQPQLLEPELFAAVWALPGKSVLTRLRLSPAAGSGSPGQRSTAVALTALVRHDLAGAGHHDGEQPPAELGLRPLRGLQRRILLDGADLETSVALRGVPAAMARFTVPAAGCGQVIGATSEGLGVAVPLFGPAVRRVEIVGSLRLTQLMVLRAIAVGARVIVHSTRPDAWEKLIRAVDAPAALSLPSAGGAHYAAAATMIVYDGVTSAGQVSEATAVHVRAPREPSAALLGADVALIESTEAPGSVLIRGAGRELAVRVVSIQEEAEYLDGIAPEAESEAEVATEQALQSV